MIDATENPPTYGAAFTDIRGFVFGGWYLALKGLSLFQRGANSGMYVRRETMKTTLGDLTRATNDPHYRIDVASFYEDVLPTLSEKDLIILLNADGQRTDRVTDLVEKVLAKSASTRFAIVSWTRTGFVASASQPFSLPKATTLT